MIAALLAAALVAVSSPPSVQKSPDAVARRYGLAGEVLIGRGDRVVLDRAYGRIDPMRSARHRVGQRWRLASITKQVTATQIMKMVARGDLALDTPLRSLQGSNGSTGLTVRMLLTHHSGLANPDDTQRSGSQFPAFYRAKRPNLKYCLSKPGVPDSPFSYNNCDYLLLGELFEAGKGSAGGIDNSLVPGASAKPGEVGVAGYVGGKLEPTVNLSTFGAAGGLIGRARDVFAFDRKLMRGELLPPAALAELWKPEGGRSYQALGQWVFPGQLAGCTTPHRIVQRDGEIGGVQTRNYILPDDDIAVVLFTNRSADDFAIGEIWQGKGFAYDLLSAVVCR